MTVFIGLGSRREFRAAIKELDEYVDILDSAITKGTPVHPRLAAVFTSVSGSADPMVQMRAVREMRSRIDTEFDDQLRAAGPHKLSHFCEYLSRNEPPAFHHEYLIDFMERIHTKEVMRLMISMPPGAAKSTYASIRFPAWHLGRKPNDRWLQGAHGMTFAKDRLGKPVRSVITDTRYREMFPEMALSSDSKAAEYFEFAGKASGYYKAVGVGTGISGFRAEIGAIDDPLASREDAESETVRRKLREWFDDDFSTRPMPNSPMYLVQTRWHEDDLAGHLLDKMKKGGEPWEVINIPALAEENDPLGRKPGEGLWPEVFGTAFYLNKKLNMSGRSWNSLYMGTPIDEEGGVLKRAQVKRYVDIPEDRMDRGRVIKKIVKRVTMSVDTAIKATKRSDWTSATIWIETTDSKHYLIHADRCREEFVEMCKWIDAMAAQFDVNQILVEDKGSGTQYIQVRAVTPGPAPVIAISTDNKSKEFRFDGITPMFSGGQALLPEKAIWVADVEAQLFAFPNGRHDDYVDSVSQYLARARETSSDRRGVRKNRSNQTR